MSTASLTKRTVKKLRFSGTNSTQLWSQLLLIFPCRGNWRLSLCSLLKSLLVMSREIFTGYFFNFEVNFPLRVIIHTTRGFIYKVRAKNTVFRIIIFSCIFTYHIPFICPLPVCSISLCFLYFQAAHNSFPVLLAMGQDHSN